MSTAYRVTQCDLSIAYDRARKCNAIYATLPGGVRTSWPGPLVPDDHFYALLDVITGDLPYLDITVTAPDPPPFVEVPDAPEGAEWVLGKFEDALTCADAMGEITRLAVRYRTFDGRTCCMIYSVPPSQAEQDLKALSEQQRDENELLLLIVPAGPGAPWRVRDRKFVKRYDPLW